MYVSTFNREISKTLGVLLINITVGSKTSLSFFFMINSIANYNVLPGTEFMSIGVCRPPFTIFFRFVKVME